jgi:hypothetical protein
VVSKSLECPQTSTRRSWVSKARAAQSSSCCQVTTTALCNHTLKTAPENRPCGIQMSVLWDRAGDPVNCLANSSIRATALSCTTAAAASWLSTQLSCSFSPPDVSTLRDTLPRYHFRLAAPCI